MRQLFIAGCLTVIAGCGGFRSDSSGLPDEKQWDEKVAVEAYLFDAKLRRDKKPTSVRLEFYHTDSVIAIAGRGYFGKGALKGRLSADSLEVYFPTTDEYLLGPVADVLGSIKCTGAMPRLSLVALFNNLPDSALAGSGLTVESDYKDKRHPEFKISSENCSWEIRLTYAFQRKGWRIKEFEFDDGEKNTFKGKRRTYKRETKVKAKKFYVPVKPGSQRIIL